MTTLTAKTNRGAISGKMPYPLTRQTLPFVRTIRGNMSGLFTNVTVDRLAPVPNLTTERTYPKETGNGPPKIYADHTSPSGNVMEVGPVLMADILNRSEKFEGVLNIRIRRIKGKIVNKDICPVRGWRGRRNYSHLNTTHI